MFCQELLLWQDVYVYMVLVLHLLCALLCRQWSGVGQWEGREGGLVESEDTLQILSTGSWPPTVTTATLP